MRRIIAIAVLLLCLAGPRVQHRGEICHACRPELWNTHMVVNHV